MASSRTVGAVTPLQPTDYHLFVSYSRADWTHVQLLTSALKSVGIRYWIDFESLVPGQPWRDAIQGALDRAHGLMFCLSPLSLESVWAGREVKAARERELRLIPVMVDYIQPADLPSDLRDLHIIDMTRLPISAAGPVVVQRIAEAIGFQIEGIRPPIDLFEGIIFDVPGLSPNRRLDVSHLVPPGHKNISHVAISRIDPATLASVRELVDRAGWVILAVGDTSDAVAMLAGVVGSRVLPGRLTIVQPASTSRSMERLADALRAKHYLV